MKKQEIQKRYNSIQDMRRYARGEVVGLILTRDGYIDQRNSKEINLITDARKEIDKLFREILNENIEK